MRKLVYSTLAIGGALVVAFGANTLEASAADTTAGLKVLKDVSGGDDLVVSQSKEGQILVGVAKTKADGLVVSTWDTYDTDGTNKTAFIDLSKYARTKDTILQLRSGTVSESDSDEFLTVLLKASDTIKVKYDKKTGEFAVTKKDGSAYAGSLQYRTEGSGIVKKVTVGAGKIDGASPTSWTEGTSAKTGTFKSDLDKYQMSGAAVYFSVPVTMLAADADTMVDGKTSGSWSGKAIELPNRGSKEVKTAVGKIPNAPKVKVNYLKGTITIPKGAVYKKLDASSNGLAKEKYQTEVAWNNTAGLDKPLEIAVSNLTTETPADGSTINGVGANFGVDVRVPAQSGKSLASRIGHNVYAPMATIEPEAADAALTAANAKIATVVKPDIKTDDKTGKLEINVDNSTDSNHAYTIFYTKNGKEASTQVKAGAKGVVKAPDPYTELYIQRNGNSKKGSEEWASNKALYQSKKKIVPQLKITGTGTVTKIKVTSNSTKKTATAVESIEYTGDSGDKPLSKAVASPEDTVEITVTGTNESNVVVTGTNKKEIKKGDTTNKTITFTMPSQAVSVAGTEKQAAS